MKVNRIALSALVLYFKITIPKRRKGFPPLGVYKEFLDVPYMNDKNIHHKYDVFIAGDNRKHVCILDVHGGSYLFSEHRDNYAFGFKFLEQGFDFIALDYLPNNGRRDTKDLVSDCILNLNHIFEHLKDYDLENDQFVIMGDSAGGHFALLLAEIMTNKELQKSLGFNLHDFNLKGVLLNCPVYDFEFTGVGALTRGGMKRMFGKHYSLEKMRLMSPREYIQDFKLPLFLSTCKLDFIRHESMKLNEDMSKKENKYVFVDIDSDKEKVDHVHNVVRPSLEESIQVNQAMFDFIDSVTK